VRPKVDQLSLPHLGITKTELKRETDEQISPVNHLEPWDQFDWQEQTKVEDKILFEQQNSKQATLLTITKALTKTTNCTCRAKKVEGHNENFPRHFVPQMCPTHATFQIRSGVTGDNDNGS